jgi:hypothetical protein
VIGVADLHALGHAHTGIKAANIFVDNGTAFLDDLCRVHHCAGEI